MVNEKPMFWTGSLFRAGQTQTLGAVLMPDNTGNGDKAGILLGGVVSATLLANPDPIAISAATVQDLQGLGIQDFNGLVPDDLFTWSSLLTLRGFVVIVIGGIGSIRGALLGALLVGMVDTRRSLEIMENLLSEVGREQATTDEVREMLGLHKNSFTAESPRTQRRGAQSSVQ